MGCDEANGRQAEDGAADEEARRLLEALLQTDCGRHVFAPGADGQPRLDRWVIRERIGGGSFAHVYRAHDEELATPRALKILRPELRWSAGATEAFIQEAQNAARVSHENIVPIHHVLHPSDEFPFPVIVMDFVEGGSLRGRLRRGPLGPREIALVGLQAAEGLAFAHGRGVVHRDIKPENLLLSDERITRIKIADFGVARAVDVPHGEPGLAGSIPYMSPEQLRPPHEAAGPADVFGLGVTLYELATHQTPFRGGERKEHAPACGARPVRSHRPDFPPDLEAVIMACLAFAPANRPTAAGLKEELRRFIEDEPVEARRGQYSRRERFARWARKKPGEFRFAVALAALVILAVCGTSFLAYRNARLAAAAQQEAERAKSTAALVQANSRVLAQSGVVALLSGDRQQSQGYFRKLIAVSAELVALHPDNNDHRYDLARWQMFYANWLLTGSNAPAELREAVALYEQSVGVFTEAVRRFPDNHQYRHRLADTLDNLGMARLALNDPAGAEKAHQESLPHRKALVGGPGAAEGIDRAYYASTLNHLGNACKAQERTDDALAFYQQAVDLYEKLVVLFPATLTHQHELAQILVNMAGLDAGGRPGDADRRLGRALALLRALSLRPDRLPGYGIDHGAALVTLGDLRRQAREWAAALEAYDEAGRQLRWALERDPKNGVGLQYEVEASAGRTLCLLALKDPRAPDRAKDLSRLCAGRPTPPRAAVKAAAALAACKEYRDQAVQILLDAEKQGAFLPAAQRNELRNAPWGPLRDREDFRRLLERVGGGAKGRP
jgi:tetratricopeptide (TPR) repeat protein